MSMQMGNQVGMYSVYDSKAGAWIQPFFAPNNAVALRAFHTAACDPTHDFHIHGADYTLFHVGDWDQHQGRLIPLDSNVNLGNALTLQEGLL